MDGLYTVGMNSGPKPLAWQERIMRRISPEPNSGCWLWEGGLTVAGYGKTWRNGRRGGTVTAHRLMWEKENGPVPDGMWVLHRCDVRACCNPEHLFLGTHADNMQDMMAKGRHGYLKRDHCKNGHEFTEQNTYRRHDQRVCRKCAAAAAQRRRARRS